MTCKRRVIYTCRGFRTSVFVEVSWRFFWRSTKGWSKGSTKSLNWQIERWFWETSEEAPTANKMEQLLQSPTNGYELLFNIRTTMTRISSHLVSYVRPSLRLELLLRWAHSVAGDDVSRWQSHKYLLFHNPTKTTPCQKQSTWSNKEETADVGAGSPTRPLADPLSKSNEYKSHKKFKTLLFRRTFGGKYQQIFSKNNWEMLKDKYKVEARFLNTFACTR